jgi:hypothetical protein
LISASVEAIVGLLKIENGWILIQFAFVTSPAAAEKMLGQWLNATARNVKRTALALYIEGEQGEKSAGNCCNEQCAGNDNAG